MLYNWDEINKEYGYPNKVREAVTAGEIYKVRRGLYSDQPSASPFSVISVKYPYAIVTMDTAFYIHGLTDVVPDRIFLATKRNATRIMDPNIRQVFLNGRIFEPGRTSILYDGVEISIYNKERMLIEAMRNSKSIPFDYYKEVISGYRNISDKLDYQIIEEYMALFKRNDYMFQILRREVL